MLGKLGRALGGSGAVLGVSGILVLFARGATDLLFVDYALHNGLLGVGFGVVVWMGMPRQPRNRAIWALAGSALFTGLYAASDAVLHVVGDLRGFDVSLEAVQNLSPATVPGPIAIVAALLTWTWLPGFFLPLTFGLLLFPDGELPSPRWRPLGYVTGVLIVAATAAMIVAFLPGSTNLYGTEEFADFGGFAGSVAITLPLVLLASLACAASLIFRYRSSHASERQQIRWIATGGATLGLTLTIGVVDSGVGAGASAWDPFILAGIVFFAASFGVAITKYRLYEIDVVISKTVTYLGLAAVITALYGAVVVGPVLLLGAGNDADSGLVLPIVATAIVAIAFEPVRTRLQRWANRLVYGERATPHELLSDVTARLADVSDAEASLSGLASLLQQGTGAERASVWLDVGGTLRPQAAAPTEHLNQLGEPPADDEPMSTGSKLTVPVVHAGEVLGALRIDKKRNDPVTPADQQLLDDVAAAAGLRLRNLRLHAQLAERAEELRASRRRLIAAHDAARHRLERDLHDGAQQQVVALKVKLGLVKSIAQREGAHEVAAAVERLAQGTQEAVDEMRLLARGIYPPLLEAEGLAPTLAGLDRHADVPVNVRTEGLERYPRPIEETVYFCAAALVSIGAMAGASTVELDVVSDETLCLAARFLGASGEFDLGTLSDRVDALSGQMELDRGDAIVVTVTLPVETLEPV